MPFEPSSDRAIAAMLELAQLKSTEVVYDLGCGDGRVVIEASRRSGARGVGGRSGPEADATRSRNALRAGVAARVSFRTEDLFTTDIRDADAVLLFLWPEINLRLLPKLLRELKPGARIVSNMHDMGSYAPTRTISLGEGKRPHRVYLWVVPDKAPK